MLARVVFDIDDIDAAFAELDARYLAGEAAAHAHTWSVIARSLRRVQPARAPRDSTPDWVNIDHRRAIAFAPGEMTAYIRATWDDSPDVRFYIEAVHRLSDLGAVVTHRDNRDLATGLRGRVADRQPLYGRRRPFQPHASCSTRQTSTPRSRGSTSSVDRRRAGKRGKPKWRALLDVYFAARDWAAMAECWPTTLFIDDRRRVVNGGVRHGRDAEIADMRAARRPRCHGRDVDRHCDPRRAPRPFVRASRVATVAPEAFHTDVLNIVEIDADNRIVARVVFDLDDIDAAFAELDARYLAGEAAAHARHWSCHARLRRINRHELPATTPDWVNIDHRRG